MQSKQATAKKSIGHETWFTLRPFYTFYKVKSEKADTSSIQTSELLNISFFLLIRRGIGRRRSYNTIIKAACDSRVGKEYHRCPTGDLVELVILSVLIRFNLENYKG